MKRFIVFGLVILVSLALATLIIILGQSGLLSPDALQTPRPLQRYAFNRLQRAGFPKNDLKLEKVIRENEFFLTYQFSYQSWGKKITGLANIPAEIRNSKFEIQKYPVIVMIRGYVDAKDYTPGIGSQRSAEYFARNGFITLTPDFLGYGGSDPVYPDALQTRFDAPVEVLSLIASVPSLPQADPTRVGIWAHSNGGQIALSVLEISNRAYPTTLWAPVTKPFPENILNYDSEMPDRGEYLMKIVGDFEKEYDPRLYSVTEFLRWIAGPLQLQQGMADESVPPEWSNEFVARMASLKREVTYYKYPGENHNFNKGWWQTAATRDLIFFKKWLF